MLPGETCLQGGHLGAVPFAPQSVSTGLYIRCVCVSETLPSSLEERNRRIGISGPVRRLQKVRMRRYLSSGSGRPLRLDSAGS